MERVSRPNESVFHTPVGLGMRDALFCGSEVQDGRDGLECSLISLSLGHSLGKTPCRYAPGKRI